MGFFSKSEPKEGELPTSAPPVKGEEEEPKEGGIFCGMNLIDLSIFAFMAFLFVFFVLWPLITTYLCLACMWLLLWPFVNCIPSCGRHRFIGPAHRVLGVAVKSPIKMGTFIWHQFHSGKKPEEVATDVAVGAAVASVTDAAANPTTTPVPQAMQKV